MATVIIEDQLEVPRDLRNLCEFRHWALSAAFPEAGRIDYIAGTIEVDMSPEEYYSHNAVKVELVRVLASLVKECNLGELYSDHARIASEAAALSAEPDVVFFSHETLNSGRVRMVPKAGKTDLFIEAEGGPDMVAEIVSDGSVSKDTKRLPLAYFEAGVTEYWLIDARKENLDFKLYGRGLDQFEQVASDSQGFQSSGIFGQLVRLDRSRNERGHWVYDLVTKKL